MLDPGVRVEDMASVHEEGTRQAVRPMRLQMRKSVGGGVI